MPVNIELSKAEQQRFSIPPAIKFYGPAPFGSMNRQASRMMIPDNENYWTENLIKVGDGNLRAVPDCGTPVFMLPTADPRTLISFFWFNIGLDDLCFLFFDDGSVFQVNAAGVGTVVIPPGPGPFYVHGGAYPACVGWGAIYLLISNNNTPNDYWAWDGGVLYTAGGVSPQVNITSGGQSYIGVPTITVIGGHGTGIAVQAIVNNGTVTALKIGAPGTGYVVGDVVQAIFSGGGSDTGAILGAALYPTAVNDVVVLAGGTGYVAAPTVSFSGGGGSGAAGFATISGGRVVSVTMTSGGTGYSSAPVVSFIGGAGSGAQARATLVAAGVAGVSVSDGGTNYSAVPVLTFQGGGGSGAAGTAVMSGPGPIANITVTDGGTGYTSIPTVTITDGGSGTGATAVVSQVTGGVIDTITVIDPGANYSSPVVTITGGGGASATADAALGGGSIVSVTITNPGGNYIDSPAIIVQSGINSAASAIFNLMPFGISGSSIETYQSQVWVQNPFHPTGTDPTGGVRNSSAPNSISDFATSSGGLSETVTDRFLRRYLTAIRQSNGFLYPYGDSSVAVISNVQVQGNPATKTLTNQNTDPQTGTHWRDTLQDFSRTTLFANPFGVFGLFGGAVTKISAKMDLVFSSARFPVGENPVPPTDVIPITPTAAVANLYNRKVYLLLINLQDPFTLGYRNAMVAWNEQDWSIVSQSIDLVYIGTRETNSQLSAWGTEGRGVYPMMVVPSRAVTKIYCSKLWGAQNPYMTKNARIFYAQAQNFAQPDRAPLFQLNIDTEYMTIPAQSNPTLAGMPPSVVPPAAGPPVQSSPLLMASTGDVPGQQLGFTLTSDDADFAVYNMLLASEDIAVFFG